MYTGNENINALIILDNIEQKRTLCTVSWTLYVFNSLLTYLFSVNFLSVGFIARIEIIFPVPIGTASGTEKGTLCVIIMNWMVKRFQHNYSTKVPTSFWSTLCLQTPQKISNLFWFWRICNCKKLGSISVKWLNGCRKFLTLMIVM